MKNVKEDNTIKLGLNFINFVCYIHFATDHLNKLFKTILEI
ncbi:hypothetical protein [Clostridium tetani]|nr:hypothetical protein [Clostridium tetani]CDI49032.1 hypothetical protein BN906_01023 [Clostridium tetani 12124569]